MEAQQLKSEMVVSFKGWSYWVGSDSATYKVSAAKLRVDELVMDIDDGAGNFYTVRMKCSKTTDTIVGVWSYRRYNTTNTCTGVVYRRDGHLLISGDWKEDGEHYKWFVELLEDG